MNNYTIGVNFDGYDGNNYEGYASWGETYADDPDVLEYILSIGFSNWQEFGDYRDTYANKHDGDTSNMNTQCNVEVDGHNVAPSSFSILDVNW